MSLVTISAVEHVDSPGTGSGSTIGKRLADFVAPGSLSIRGPRRADVAMAVVLVALTTTIVGCGGAGTTTGTGQARVAEARWRAGFARWHENVIRALYGISIAFSTAESVIRLENDHSQAYRALQRDELALAGCAASVDRLGAAPPTLVLTRRYALEACANLEKGERLVEVALDNIRTSNSLNPLDAASGPLSNGENDASAAAALEQASH